MFEIHDQLARARIIKRRRALRLPHSADQILTKSLDILKAHEGSHSWCLPATKFTDEMSHYYFRHKSYGLKGPRPKLRVSPLAEEMAIKIDAGLSFAELACSADPMVRPIILYYACAHLCGVYMRAFFNWEQDDRSHGLTCVHNSSNVADTRVVISNGGQFPRLSATCFLLTGRPSCFSTLVTYSASPTSHTNPGEFLASFGKSEIGTPITELTLHELVTMNYGERLKLVRIAHGFHKFQGLPTTAFLVDVITLFVASSLARYDVLGWKSILEGKNNSYRIYFEETFERFQSFAIDALMAVLENPLTDFDNRTLPSQPSPYSHDDRTRFENDPNQVP